MLTTDRFLQHVFARFLGEDSEFGVHITFQDLYRSVLFFACIYVSGLIASRILKMPSLVGEIVCGILLGPPLADFVPNPLAFVMLGEIGLILLLLEAGIDVDLTTLKLIGSRGFLIAIVGSILPIAIGIGLAFAFGTDTKGALAAGACFGPTSLGIAMNVLRAGKIVNTPVGQLIVSAAVIDDMIALVILSLLESLVGEITASGIIIPIVSALCWLFLGGLAAITIVPRIINNYILPRIPETYQSKMELALALGFLIALMPATYYTKASYLMGSFISGLAFCRSHGLHLEFARQFKRILQWLMRIFFAASIGFQVPIKDFGDGTVIWQGLVFTVSLLGKLATGFLVPNFNQTKRFTHLHLRDCLTTGFSMAAEGEFAFVIAVFSVDNGLISRDLYASIVLAVLISTIIPPFLLRYTINYYNKKSEEIVRLAAEQELQQKIKQDLEAGSAALESTSESKLLSAIKNRKTLFLCIQTQSEAQWGLLHKLMNVMNKKGLEVIDHRSWHPRGVNTTLVNEVYAKDSFVPDEARPSESIEERMEEMKEALAAVMPADAKVKVQRWYPGVVEEIVEEVTENVRSKSKGRLNIQDELLAEASKALESHRTHQTQATKERTVEEILKDVTLPEPTLASATAGSEAPTTRRPRRRQKMRSTPVVGGGLFGETDRSSVHGKPSSKEGSGTSSFFADAPGETAELIVDGESYQVRVTRQTIENVQRGYRGEMIEDSGISVAAATPIVNRLHGYVRYPTPLGRIDEMSDAPSEDTDAESGKNA